MNDFGHIDMLNTDSSHMSGDTGFSELLRSAEQLSAAVEGTEELPQVERNLRQILDASNELWSRVTQTGTQDNEVQAHLLLGSRGVDLPQISQKLNSLSARRTFEPLDPIADTDIVSYLRNEKENAILSIIEQVHKDTFELTRVQQMEHMLGEWKQMRFEIINAMTAPSGELVDLRGTPQRTKLAGSMVSGLSNVEVAYVKELQNYNDHVLRGITRPSLFNAFCKAAESFNDKKIVDLWQMVKYMVDIPPIPREDQIKSRSTPIVEKRIVLQARKYLENRYRDFMTSVISENLAQAKRGGIPGTVPLVKSFVSVKVQNLRDLEDVVVADKPLWPLVYYCMRVGDYKAALQCLNQCNAEFPEFKTALEEACNDPEKHPSSYAESNLKLHYRKHVRSVTDPYKRVAYCALVPCETEDLHADVICTADDYLWLKLCQVRDQPDSENKLTLDYLQTTISEIYGESYYHAHEQPFVYFSMLFLTGQFEAAIEFLARGAGARLLPHAVHLAAAMHEHNLLGVSQSVLAPLLSVDPADKPPAKRLNFARLILLYVKRFDSTDPKECLHYLFLLRNMKDPHDRNMFAASTAEMVVDASLANRTQLVGKIDKDRWIPGVLDQFQINTQDVINISADTLYRKGLLEDAVTMYDLAGNHEKVLSLLCTLLAQVVSQNSSALRSRLQLTSTDISTRYQGIEIQAPSELVSAFHTLRHLMVFFDQFHNEQYQSALRTIGKSKLLPLHVRKVDERVNALRRVSPEVAGTLADVLLATMTILYRQYQKLRSMEPGDEEARKQQLLDLREQARALTSFAGTLPYRMPNETNSKLVQMEILMC
ncbi:PREDICTED: nuclear pore complex protein Nup93-like [Dufourea novaeangliae]|uniref:Nuclear pore protein n=1 Tax=Dufourea novaeangliae TaxID=178035 RepID=A0A154P729_DUFNO|nr:PREDICTED: nuclear pore complex protein Nup93-like [Dufourea novaeangliae]KZC06930.1 Nuclear pore complex protein Nup93 [Dufourea novaeangliae]